MTNAKKATDRVQVGSHWLKPTLGQGARMTRTMKQAALSVATIAIRKRHLSWRRAVSLALVCLVGGGLPATAGPETHECQAVEGYRIDWDTKKVHATGGREAIDASVQEEVHLSQLTGHCISGADRFDFDRQVYGLSVEFEVGGKKLRRKFVCILSKYETPAGRSCDREVRKIDWNAPARLRRAFE